MAKITFQTATFKFATGGKIYTVKFEHIPGLEARNFCWNAVLWHADSILADYNIRQAPTMTAAKRIITLYLKEKAND